MRRKSINHRNTGRETANNKIQKPDGTFQKQVKKEKLKVKLIIISIFLVNILIMGGIFDSKSQITSTFGEFRNEYFHMGIDLIPETEGDTPIYSLTDGTLYRIKFKRFGYGRAVYIQDDEGNIYVYAHLESFAERFVRDIFFPEWQDEGKLYGDYYFNRENDRKYEIKKGEFLGYMGNAGVESGAHLHFEIRKKETIVVNPLNFIEIKDEIAPTIKEILFVSYNNKKFIDIGCYDLADNDHKLGIYGVSIDDNTRIFDEIDYRDYKTGRDTYDLGRTSYNLYYYKIPIKENRWTLSIFDYFAHIQKMDVEIPPEIFDRDNIIYDLFTKKVKKIDLRDNFERKSLKKKIKILNKRGEIFVNVKKRKKGIGIDIEPYFLDLDNYVDIKINLKKREALYKLSKKGSRSYYSNKPNLKLNSGRYVILKDSRSPVLYYENGNFVIKDELSGLNYEKISVKMKQGILRIERDFNIDDKGNLVFFRKFKGKAKIILYDKMGNKKIYKIDQSRVKILTNPFSKP